MSDKVSALSFVNLAREFLDAFIAVEYECPPDEYDAWPSDAEDLIEYRNRVEKNLKEMIQLANENGIEDDI